MDKPPILVDSSVWIDFFKSENPNVLDRYLEENLVSTNDIILTELLPQLLVDRKQVIVEGLTSLYKIPLNIDWDLVRHYQLLNLKNGINRVGLPDLIILQQVLEEKLTLFSYDKHFMLMRQFLKFDLIQ